MIKRKKVGLALGSGGVRGFAHIGVIKTLEKNGIPIDYLSGCSIGSWVGAHYALYKNIRKTADFTVGRRKEKLFSFLEPSASGGLVKGRKLETLLDDWLDGASFDDLKIPFKVAATDLLTGRKASFSKGKLAPIVCASMAVPGFFKPVTIKDKVLIDGGVSDPVPVDLVKELGAEVVIAVNLDFFAGFPNISPKDIGYTNVADGTVKIMRHHLAQYACRGADFVIQPELRDFSSWSNYFTGRTNNDEIIKLAQAATEQIIPRLKEQIFGED
jgi:NTE family protein